MRGKVDTASHQFLRLGAEREMLLEEPAFAGRVECNPGGKREDILIDAQPNRWFVVSSRNQDTATRGDLQAEHCRCIQVGEEDQRVIRPVLSFEVRSFPLGGVV